MGKEWQQITDSGERRQFETEAVRDISQGKGRCDLMTLDVVTIVISRRIDMNIQISDISAEDMANIACKCFEHGITVSDLIKGFVADLTAGDESGGSDERDMADAYFDRRYGICYEDKEKRFIDIFDERLARSAEEWRCSPTAKGCDMLVAYLLKTVGADAQAVYEVDFSSEIEEWTDNYCDKMNIDGFCSEMQEKTYDEQCKREYREAHTIRLYIAADKKNCSTVPVIRDNADCSVDLYALPRGYIKKTSNDNTCIYCVLNRRFDEMRLSIDKSSGKPMLMPDKVVLELYDGRVF